MTDSNFETISYCEEDGVALIQIEREKSLNALNNKVLTELKNLLVDLHDKKGRLFGAILTGAGEKAFIAGADIKEMAGITVEEAAEFSELGQEVTKAFESLPFPIIACVNGYALGGGLEMALGCDYIYGTDQTVVGLPEVKLGLIPGFGGTQRLSRIIGRHRAKEMVYSGRNVKSEEALKLGIVVQNFSSKSEMLEKAKSDLQKIGANSPSGVAKAKDAINRGTDLELGKSLDLERENFSSVFGTPEMVEGTTAFIEKRLPNFQN